MCSEKWPTVSKMLPVRFEIEDSLLAVGVSVWGSAMFVNELVEGVLIRILLTPHKHLNNGMSNEKSQRPIYFKWLNVGQS